MTKPHPTPLLDAIYQAINNAPKALARVALFIARDPERIPTLSVAALARQCDSGEASVVRFCQSLGYSGFPEFKMALTAEIERKKAHFGALGSAEDEATVTPELLGISNSLQVALADTARMIDPAQIERVAERIRVARRIEIFGMGASAACADMLMVRLVWLGFAAHSPAAASISHGLARTLGPSDVAIGISNSGVSAETTRFLETARETGAFTVALTSHADSPLTQFADESLLFSSGGLWPEPGTSVHAAPIALVSEYLGRCLQRVPATA